MNKDIERLFTIMQSHRGLNLHDAVLEFADKYYSPSDIIALANGLMDMAHVKTMEMENALYVCYEKGIYLRDYLEGKTWATEEDARRNLQPQINNARIIVDVCKRK